MRGYDGEVPLPDVMLVCGIPATGKSSFCRWLAERHGYLHLDVDFLFGRPEGASLEAALRVSGSAFVAAARAHGPRVAVDWGFPVNLLGRVREIRDAGARLAWLDGGEALARRLYATRPGRDNDVANFDAQLLAIREAGLPAALGGARVIEAFGAGGIVRAVEEPEAILVEILAP